MMRSMSDEQMLAKYGYDKEPWVSWSFKSGDEFRLSEEPTNRPSRFAPRPQCIPSRDHMPWVFNYSGNRYSHIDPLLDKDWSFSPRAEFARPEVNPILTELRNLLVRFPDYPFALHVANVIEDMETIDGLHYATPDQVESALKVLTPLAAVTR